MAETIRVGIADDHALFRQGIAAVLATVDDVALVGEATDGDEAVRLAVTERPDVLLMDLRMPRVSGIEATRQVRRRAPGVAVVVLTMVDGDESLAEALRAGAAGYVLKDADPTELLGAIRAAALGGLAFGPATADRVRRLVAPTIGPWRAPLPQLSDRERSVLDLYAAGHPVAVIASTLALSPKTVRNYLTAIPRRLGVATRDEAAAMARQAGLGRRDAP